MNLRAIWAIYYFEMARTARTLMQSVASPVLSTSLYFVVFGSAIGSVIPEIEGVSYGAFIVQGLPLIALAVDHGAAIVRSPESPQPPIGTDRRPGQLHRVRGEVRHVRAHVHDVGDCEQPHHRGRDRAGRDRKGDEHRG